MANLQAKVKGNRESPENPSPTELENPTFVRLQTER